MKLSIIVVYRIGILVVGTCELPVNREGMNSKDFESRKKIGESI